MPIPGWVEQIGQGTASNAVDSVLGLVTGGAWNKMQRKNQKKQQAIQIAGQKEMTDYAMGKQLEMWKNTSYAAQKEQKTLIRAAAIGALLENQSKRLNLQVDQKKLEMLAQQIASLKITTGLASSEQAIQIQKMVHETTGIKDDDSKGIIGDILKMIKF